MSKGNKVIHSFLTDINPSHPETQEPKSNIYRGNHAFSEPETRNVRGYLQSLGGKSKGFLDFQDRGRRQWQMPWRYTFTSSPDHDIQVQLNFNPLQIRQGDFWAPKLPPPSPPRARDSSSAVSGFCQGFSLRSKMCRPSANNENSSPQARKTSGTQGKGNVDFANNFNNMTSIWRQLRHYINQIFSWGHSL